MEERLENYESCARRIQAYWRCFRDRRLFRLLMNTVRSACLASAVLRQLSPREAELLKDPSLKCKIRFRYELLLFRFAGPQFPPSLVFKIFHIGGGGHYLSGKKVFSPSNQYSSHLDELPACVGGRENGWRFLSLKVLSRDVMLREGVKPGTRDRLKTVLPFSSLARSHFAGQQLSHRGSRVSTRQSARAQNTAARKRRLYGLSEAERFAEKVDIKIVLPSVETEDYNSSESEWEEEAEKLCNWSKQLNIDALETPAFIQMEK
ncbi:uncharacterized protein [Sinocyclocheilus grahami]|uniref:uncharacterized protein n=1 Tax=Sinocyclocheilus grahami TaxID=75366 RepID=UPI0007ACD54F|nr:PREDICTED: uncharacterized protein LOC107591479 [Sinocyclocheilus grahami]